ncbi:MAG: hypothetical protein AAGB11_17100 [Pseudomonadota bacterium]
MPAKDLYSTYDRGLNAPAANAFVITPSNTDITHVTRAIYVGGAGDLEVRMVGGVRLTFTGLNAGTVLPCSVDRVFPTETTATDIIGLY